MIDGEREQILKMIEEGKISADQGVQLIQALQADDQESGLPEDLPAPEPPAAESGFPSEAPPPDPQVESLKRLARLLYLIPLGAGLLLTVWMAWAMYTSLQAHSTGFVLYCLQFPALLLGVLLLALGASSASSRWLYVDVQRKPGQKPERILISFPIDWVRFFLNLFGGVIPSKEKNMAETMLKVIAEGAREAPLVVQVDEGADGEKVNVYIG